MSHRSPLAWSTVNDIIERKMTQKKQRSHMHKLRSVQRATDSSLPLSQNLSHLKYNLKLRAKKKERRDFIRQQNKVIYGNIAKMQDNPAVVDHINYNHSTWKALRSRAPERRRMEKQRYRDNIIFASRLRKAHFPDPCGSPTPQKVSSPTHRSELNLKWGSKLQLVLNKPCAEDIRSALLAPHCLSAARPLSRRSSAQFGPAYKNEVKGLTPELYKSTSKNRLGISFSSSRKFSKKKEKKLSQRKKSIKRRSYRKKLHAIDSTDFDKNRKVEVVQPTTIDKEKTNISNAVLRDFKDFIQNEISHTDFIQNELSHTEFFIPATSQNSQNKGFQ